MSLPPAVITPQAVIAPGIVIAGPDPQSRARVALDPGSKLAPGSIRGPG